MLTGEFVTEYFETHTKKTPTETIKIHIRNKNKVKFTQKSTKNEYSSEWLVDFQFKLPFGLSFCVTGDRNV